VKDPGKKAFDENDPTCKDSGGGTWDKCGSVSVKVIKGRWNPTPTVFTLNITEPDSGDYCTAGETLACSAEAADTDTYIKCGETTGKEEADNIGDWKWTISPASKGSITGNGSSATYTAPADVTEGEEVTITASAKDEAKMDADDGGSRNDDRKSDSVTIKLTKKVKVWTTPSNIDPEVTSPGSGSEAGPDQKFVCKASATDSDHWYFEDDPNTGGDSPDEIPDDNYTWTCSKGSFVGGDNEGPEVVWQAPPADQITDNPNGETVTFTVTVDDKPLPPPPEDNYNKGSRNDGAKSDQGTLTLKKKVKTWTAQTSDSEKLWVSIQSPASGDLMKGGEAITVSADGGDKDHWKYNDNTGEGSEEDSVDYEWSGPGSFSPTTGKSTSWTPPNTSGNATIKVEADDKPLPPPPEDNYNKGSREDGTDEDSVTVKVDADTPVVNITAVDPLYDSGAKKYVPASFRVDVSATDEVGLKSVSCNPPGQTRGYSKPGPKSASESFNVTGQTDGDKTITATAKDWVDHEGSAPKDVTVDTTPPESWINALPETVSTTSFQVSWQGTDGGSGVKNYDVQYKVDSEGWQDWLTGTTAQTAQFTGERGHRYCFQCRARDNIGNEEQYPGGDGDTCTIVPGLQSVVSSKPTIMTGGVASEVHQSILTATVIPSTLTGTVTFSIEGGAGVNIPAGLSLLGGPGRSQSVSVSITNGQAQAILTSSDFEESVTVEATFEQDERFVTVGQAAGGWIPPDGFVCVPSELTADGVSTANINFYLVQSGTSLPVPGHEMVFVIDSITDANGQPVNGPPFPSEYGTIIQPQGQTNADGLATGVFHVGTEPATINIRAEDNNDQVP